eukprot:4813843-Prorocentrum_lima.AAC.1
MHVGPSQVTEQAASHLATVQWSPPDLEIPSPPELPLLGDAIPSQEVLLEFDLGELKMVLKHFKCHKAPGPDEVRMELYKYLPDEALINILELFNH